MSEIRELEKTLVSYKYPEQRAFRVGENVYFIKDGYRYSGMVIQFKFGYYRIMSDSFEGLVQVPPNQVESKIL